MGIIDKDISNARIGIIGLGYVGLPLAVAFAEKYPVVGFDIQEKRISDLIAGVDRTHEADLEELKSVLIADGKPAATGLTLSSAISALYPCNVYIVTVPTPIDQFKAPDLKPLKQATKMLAPLLKNGDLVIYESTVYPGCTEEICVPILESETGLCYNEGFFVGYSPERINPGDKVNTLTTIKKVTSGSGPAAAVRVDELYRSIIAAGTHLAPSIKIAEASKAIENAQRDLNISFVNELALIFDRIGIDTNDVLEAAGTKWNFLPYKPGLVGGHCIGVDPYYLTHKAQAVGYHPQVILSGRRVNEQMGSFVANKLVKMLVEKGHKLKSSRVLIMGITFKENCPDVRNTRVVDIYNELVSFGLSVDIYDPWADADEVAGIYGLTISNVVNDRIDYDAVVVAVAHNEFATFDYKRIKNNNGVIYDTKGVVERGLVDGRL